MKRFFITAAIIASLPLPSYASEFESECRYDHIPKQGIAYIDVRITDPGESNSKWRRDAHTNGTELPFITRNFETSHPRTDVPQAKRANSGLISEVSPFALTAKQLPGSIEHLLISEMENRHARLLNQEYIEREEVIAGEEETIRYYSLYTDNCQSAYVRIPVDRKPFSYQLNPLDDRADGKLDFSQLEDALSLVVLEDWKNLTTHKGKTITVIPDGHRGIKVISEDMSQKAYVTPLETFTLINTSRHPLVIDDRQLSPIHLLVKDADGKVWRMPWKANKIYLGDALKKKGVRSKFKASIAEGRIEDGMNKTEVALVTGLPKLEREYPIFYAKKGQGKFIIDESFRMDGFSKSYRTLPELKYAPEGHQSGWFFHHLSDEDTYLRFDENGELDINNQPPSAMKLFHHDWRDDYAMHKVKK